MDLSVDAVKLRVYLGESKKLGHLPLYEAIVLKAKETDLAGATVFRCPMGYGAGSELHTAKILSLSSDLPMVIEIVDTEEKIGSFLPLLREMMDGGRATLEKVKMIHYPPRSTA